MFTWVAKKVFGTANDRAVRQMHSQVSRINELESGFAKLSDDALKAKTVEFKERIDRGESLDSLLAEAFGVCREASKRVLGMRHYDVQLMGGMTLHRGAIAEMRTGEGKTLVATLPVYLNGLTGKGVHVVTVNDYLATRDAEWMGRLYSWLGLTWGTVVSGQSGVAKRRAYQSDIAYGQNNEFGFDYLRDNMKFSALEYVQRPLNFAIVDEVDSILIDEARTPLIISGPADAASDKYRTLNELIPRLRKEEHYIVDEKGHSVTLTDDGVELVQQLVGIDNLYKPEHIQTLHILSQCLRAHTLYQRDIKYMVSPEGKIVIIDEFTGRALSGRRWSDGLHQAVEAKENVEIQEESRTMASITFQNLFRIYNKLGGMTGTGQTEAQEFHSTYKLDVVTIPTNRPIQRVDHEDTVFKNERGKFAAVIQEIINTREAGRPVLIGTTSVDKSAAIARILKRKNIPHQVLNAKQHENEAYVVAQAGRPGSITVSTNMAGRGTDILLGGNPEMLARLEFREAGRDEDAEPEAFAALVSQHEIECKEAREAVKKAGGLHIIGTERHESRRIDNQLRGRAGRQGDPGSSKFFLSLEDDLMRIFAGDQVKSLMDRLGMPDDEPIEHPWVTKSVANAQEKVEQRNFDIRKNVLEYDDVMNAQRKTIYSLREAILTGRYAPEEVDELGKSRGIEREIELNEELSERIKPMVSQFVGMFCDPPVHHLDENGKLMVPSREQIKAAEKLVESKDLKQLQSEIYQLWGVVVPVDERLKRTPLELLDQVEDLAGRGLSEQRERLLDLIDRVLAVIVEECCPPNRQAEDWDWPALKKAFREHFGEPLDENIDELGDVDALMSAMYKKAEGLYLQFEEQVGAENILRGFRHFYLQELDSLWVDHLSSMDHLREGIGLRGYGQRDPRQEYKKEGYNLFLNLMAQVSGSVLSKLFEQHPSRQQLEAMEQEATLKHQAELAKITARHIGESMPPPAPAVPEEPAVASEMPCPCGSGEAFSACHGKVD